MLDAERWCVYKYPWVNQPGVGSSLEQYISVQAIWNEIRILTILWLATAFCISMLLNCREKLKDWLIIITYLDGIVLNFLGVLVVSGHPYEGSFSKQCYVNDNWQFLYSNLLHIVRWLFGTLDPASHWFSQVSASPISSLVMFPEQGEQVSLALPKYPALHTTNEKETSYHFFQANQRKANIKIHLWTQYEISGNRCDWLTLSPGHTQRLRQHWR